MASLWLHRPADMLSHPLHSSVLHAPSSQPYMLRAPLRADTLSFYPSVPAAQQPAPPPPPPPPQSLASPKRAAKKLFRCPFPNCSQTSSNKGNLSKHIATRHEHRKDFVCPFNGCNRRFAKKYNMLRHLSASGVHRASPGASPTLKMAGKKRASDRAKWSSMELDLAKFLAEQCRPALLA